MRHLWKLLSKDGHESCILENVRQKGIAWKDRAQGLGFDQNKSEAGTEEVGMESRDTLEYFFGRLKKQAYY